MDELDRNLLKDLAKNSRLNYAELGRKYDLSRVCIRDRIINLVDKGIIEDFTIHVNFNKLGYKLSVVFDIEVKPDSIFKIAEELTGEENVVKVLLMTGKVNLHVYAVMKDQDELECFLREKLFKKEGVVRVESNIILKNFDDSKKGMPALF